MELLLSILLYLGVVTTGSTYTQAEIDMMVQHHEQDVNYVVIDPTLSSQVLTDNRNNIIGLIEPDEGEQ